MQGVLPGLAQAVALGYLDWAASPWQTWARCWKEGSVSMACLKYSKQAVVSNDSTCFLDGIRLLILPLHI